MKHYGDIMKISGAEVEPVDIITGGSPCQDLSVAGKRAGLSGERSGLFMEQIRIIKEMRNETNNKQPRYMVWENVPGAFSSNKGEDFRIVLEETAKVADKDAVISRPPKGKWQPAGCIMGDGWSIAWRVHDAQFWGVPQRRKRICLIADFGGETAPKILFERKSMSGDIEESRKEREETTTNIGAGTAETGRAIVLNDQGGSQMNVSKGVSGTLRSQMNGHLPIVFGISAYESNAMKSSNPHSGVYEAETARTLDLNGGSPTCNQGGMAIVQGCDLYNGLETGDVVASLTTRGGGTGSESSVICLEGNGSRPSHKGDGYAESEVMYTLNSVEQHAVAIENHPTDSRVKISEDGVVQTLSSRMGTGGNNVPMVMEPYTSSHNSHHTRFANTGVVGTLAATDYKDPTTVCTFVVRRLTPLECERLQGFPDGWTDIGDWVDSKGKTHKGESDSPRYKALGNAIALPFWKWMAERMVKALGAEHPTMASLFDGIGGFPLAFSRAGAEPI